MAKLGILLLVYFFVQVSYANRADYYNHYLGTLLRVCGQLLNEPGSAKYIDDLKKLAVILEEGLKADSIDKKIQVLEGIQDKFPVEFFSWYVHKCAEDRSNHEIQAEIKFYQSLLTANTTHKAEITKALMILENILKETDLDEKNKNLWVLEETFSADFKTFLNGIKLSEVNENLENAKQFFERLLNEKDVKFAKEIQKLKEKMTSALANNVSIEEKTKAFHDSYNIDNEELENYLINKNIEIVYS